MSIRQTDTSLVPGERISQPEIQLACFKVGSQLFALDIMSIKEIIRPQKLTPVPKSPSFIEGMIHLRGDITPVADLRKRFDQPTIETNRDTRIVICSVAGKTIGLLVDEVTEVKRIQRQDITPAPQLLTSPEANYFLGVARDNDNLIMLLDLDNILSTEEKIALNSLDKV